MTLTANSATTGRLARQPESDNLLSPLGFQFSIRRLPNVSWFLQTISLPSITLSEAPHNTPWINSYQPGDKLEYESLTLSFKVDESLENWSELQRWMIGLGSPRGSEEYRLNQLQFGQDAITTDATLIILNSNMQPNFRVTYHDVFPTQLGELQFDTQQTDVDYIATTATFRFLSYQFEKL